MLPEYVRNWRKAWPTLQCNDAVLEQAGPFPSLAVMDYIHYLESKGVDAETRRFVKDLAREVFWVYDNWVKAQRDANANELLDNVVASFGPTIPEYSAFCRMIQDYRASHNLLPPGEDTTPQWYDRKVEQVVENL
jgi:hypothetical protein